MAFLPVSSSPLQLPWLGVANIDSSRFVFAREVDHVGLGTRCRMVGMVQGAYPAAEAHDCELSSLPLASPPNDGSCLLPGCCDGRRLWWARVASGGGNPSIAEPPVGRAAVSALCGAMNRMGCEKKRRKRERDEKTLTCGPRPVVTVNLTLGSC